MSRSVNFSLVSYDDESLFPNVPLDEIIEIACNYVYDSPTKPTIDKIHFKKLLQYATSSMFMYKEKIYKQVDGVAMGSPLGPTLANLFLANLESEWMRESCSPLHYFRYIDDIFCVFNDKNKHEQFLEF